MFRPQFRIACWAGVVGLAILGVSEAKTRKTKRPKPKQAVVRATPSPKPVEDCFVKDDDDSCHGGVFFRNRPGVSLCRVGERVERAFFSSLHICETGGKVTGPLPTSLGKPCYYSDKGSKCVAGVTDLENSAICFVDGSMVGRFFSDSQCTTLVRARACWTYLETPPGEPTICDSEHVGKIVESGGLSVCQVEKKTSRDFFFDSQCEEGSVGWTAMPQVRESPAPQKKKKRNR